MTEHPQIYLASSSPRRQELLNQMGVSFIVVPQFVEEKHRPNEPPEKFVTRLAEEKAGDGLSRLDHDEIPVLGADTAVVLNKKILGKPSDKQ